MWRALIFAAAAGACSTDAATPAATCGPADATVARVIDGDTIELVGGARVRYLLIDAPETTLGHDDCYGSNAARFNRDLVAGQQIELTYDVVCNDAYGRLLAYVTVAATGTDVNALMVERGYACVLHVPPNGADRVAELEDLEAEARVEGRGVWTCDPLPNACR